MKLVVAWDEGTCYALGTTTTYTKKKRKGAAGD